MPPVAPFLHIVEQYVARCCVRETPPRVSELAELLDLSPSTMARRFRQEHPQALAAVLKRTQLRHAQTLLRHSSLSTTRIAYACGFGTRRTFFRAFLREVGMTPTRYRSLARECP